MLFKFHLLGFEETPSKTMKKTQKAEKN